MVRCRHRTATVVVMATTCLRVVCRPSANVLVWQRLQQHGRPILPPAKRLMKARHIHCHRHRSLRKTRSVLRTWDSWDFHSLLPSPYMTIRTGTAQRTASDVEYNATDQDQDRNCICSRPSPDGTSHILKSVNTPIAQFCSSFRHDQLGPSLRKAHHP